jgi:hypothetical protein
MASGSVSCPFGWSPVLVGEFSFYVAYVGAGAVWAQPASAVFVVCHGPREGFFGWGVSAGVAAEGALGCEVVLLFGHGEGALRQVGFAS